MEVYKKKFKVYFENPSLGSPVDIDADDMHLAKDTWFVFLRDTAECCRIRASTISQH